MTSLPSTQARALLDTCLSLPPVMQLISKFYIFSFGKKIVIWLLQFLLVSPALSFSPSNSSFPVDRVPILPSLQTLIVCSCSIKAKLRMWYPKFFHNLVPDSHSILCSGLPALSETLPVLYTAISSLWHALPYSRSFPNINLSPLNSHHSIQPFKGTYMFHLWRIFNHPLQLPASLLTLGKSKYLLL